LPCLFYAAVSILEVLTQHARCSAVNVRMDWDVSWGYEKFSQTNGYFSKSRYKMF